jgi:hypothetical protein
LYTSCVLGLRSFALFNEFLLIKKGKRKRKRCIQFIHECFIKELDQGCPMS